MTSKNVEMLQETSTCQLSLGRGRKDSVLRKAVAHLFAVDPKLFGASTGTASPNWKAWCSRKKCKNKVKKIKVLIIWSKGLSLFLSRYSSLSAALPPVSPLLSLLPSCCTLTTLTLQLHPLSPPLCPLPWWLQSNKMRLWNNREEGLPTPEFWPSDQL